MFRRLASTLLMVVLVAPAIAMCAGSMESTAKLENHDCCPADEITAAAAAPVSPSMAESCCRLSDEAGQRVPSVAGAVAIAPADSVAVPGFFRSIVSPTTEAVHTAPLSSDHVPRHLLLSVLIV